MTIISFSPKPLLETFPVGIQPFSGMTGIVYMMVFGAAMPPNSSSQRLKLEISQTATQCFSVPIISTMDAATELGKGLVSSIRKSAIDQYTGPKPSSQSDRRNVLCEINKQASNIARKTRRGAGNRLWINQSSMQYLETSLLTLNGYQIDTFDEIPDGIIIIGYKGGSGQTDVGIVLSTYVDQQGDTYYAITAQQRWTDYYGVVNLI